MAIFHGFGLNFGIGSTLQYVVGLFQTRDHSFIANKKEIVDGGETTVSVAYYDQKEKATFTYIVASASPNSFGTAPVFLPYVGQFCWVADSQYNQVVHNYWLVDDITTQSSNNGAMKVTVNLTYYPYLVPQ